MNSPGCTVSDTITDGKHDPVEAYEWGWAELARIEAELATEADMVSPGASPDEAAAAGNTRLVLGHTLDTVLRLLHPVVPFVNDFADSVRYRPVHLKSDEPTEPFEAGAAEMLRQKSRERGAERRASFKEGRSLPEVMCDE